MVATTVDEQIKVHMICHGRAHPACAGFSAAVVSVKAIAAASRFSTLRR
jgi:hypothetical protein